MKQYTKFQIIYDHLKGKFTMNAPASGYLVFCIGTSLLLLAFGYFLALIPEYLIRIIFN